jgi:hypothetical protein
MSAFPRRHRLSLRRRIQDSARQSIFWKGKPVRSVHLFVLVLSLAHSNAASAQTLLVGNLTGTEGVSQQLFAGGRRLASSFTLGPSFAPAELRSVMFWSQVVPFVNSATVGLQLFTNTITLPGTAIVDLGTVTFTGTASYHTYNAVTPITLQPNSTYWIVARSDSSSAGSTSTFHRSTTSSIMDSGSNPFASIPLSRAVSMDGGQSWGMESTTEAFKFRVFVAAVPEASALPFACLAATGVLAAWRRRSSVVFGIWTKH